MAKKAVLAKDQSKMEVDGEENALPKEWIEFEGKMGALQDKLLPEEMDEVRVQVDQMKKALVSIVNGSNENQVRILDDQKLEKFREKHEKLVTNLRATLKQLTTCSRAQIEIMTEPLIGFWCNGKEEIEKLCVVKLQSENAAEPEWEQKDLDMLEFLKENDLNDIDLLAKILELGNQAEIDSEKLQKEKNTFQLQNDQLREQVKDLLAKHETLLLENAGLQTSMRKAEAQIMKMKDQLRQKQGNEHVGERKIDQRRDSRCGCGRSCGVTIRLKSGHLQLRSPAAYAQAIAIHRTNPDLSSEEVSWLASSDSVIAPSEEDMCRTLKDFSKAGCTETTAILRADPKWKSACRKLDEDAKRMLTPKPKKIECHQVLIVPRMLVIESAPEVFCIRTNMDEGSDLLAKYDWDQVANVCFMARSVADHQYFAEVQKLIDSMYKQIEMIVVPLPVEGGYEDLEEAHMNFEQLNRTDAKLVKIPPKTARTGGFPVVIVDGFRHRDRNLVRRYAKKLIDVGKARNVDLTGWFDVTEPEEVRAKREKL